jgi:hypothetical protein
METIMIAKGLDLQVKNLRGKIQLERNYYNALNELIEAYYEKHGELPKIELAYGFLGKHPDNTGKFGIRYVDFRFEEMQANK